MYSLLQIMTNQFAADALITSHVGTRTNFVLDPQNAGALPLISYNALETDRITKDNVREFELTIYVLANSVTDLLRIYDDCRIVMDENVTGFTSFFQGGSPVESFEESDDVFIIDQNYRIEYKP